MSDIEYERALLMRMEQLDPEATQMYQEIKESGTPSEMRMLLHIMSNYDRTAESISQLADEVGRLAYDVEQVRQGIGSVI
jgi:hypothetical protein